MADIYPDQWHITRTTFTAYDSLYTSTSIVDPDYTGSYPKLGQTIRQIFSVRDRTYENLFEVFLSFFMGLGMYVINNVLD
jgi:hypothetical protein